jgi:hypothetical protein
MTRFPLRMNRANTPAINITLRASLLARVEECQA